jgi:hypothetical protein
VAYLLLASGHELRLQSPVTLYSFLQKFCVCILHHRHRSNTVNKKLQNPKMLQTKEKS